MSEAEQSFVSRPNKESIADGYKREIQERRLTIGALATYHPKWLEPRLSPDGKGVKGCYVRSYTDGGMVRIELPVHIFWLRKLTVAPTSLTLDSKAEEKREPFASDGVVGD